MNQSTSEHDEWLPVPHGTLHQYAQQHRDQRTPSAPLTVLLAAASAVVMVGGLVWYQVSQPDLGPVRQSPTTQPVGYHCDETIMRMEAYAAGTLAQNERELVADHLEACPGCKARLERIIAEMQAARLHCDDEIAAGDSACRENCPCPRPTCRAPMLSRGESGQLNAIEDARQSSGKDIGRGSKAKAA